MNAGDLDHRIRIEQRVPVINRLNETTYGWATFITVWANVRPLRGREFFEASQLQSEISVRFTIRYRTGIDEKMRVIWKGQAYAIVAPPIEVAAGREWIELMCKHGVGDGKD